MSGLEGPALAAGGGRLLGGLAAPAGKALARKASFRWMVWWRVRKRVDFSCNWATYRAWLKTIAPDELAKPVEDIQGPLAKRLDEALSAATQDWSSAEDHLSRALRLVELTYPAIAAALGDADRAALSESWAQQRSANVRALLLQLAGPGAALSPQDLAMVLEQRSRARRAVRLQVFQVDEADLAPYFERIEVPRVGAGEVVVLIGDFGAGKSEIAEAWHRAGIKNFKAGVDRAVPVWLNAHDLIGQRLEDAVDRQLGPSWHGRGASVAIDGLDEAGPAAGQTLLEAARTMARTYAGVRVFLTARPGILSPTPTEETRAKLLSEPEALELVELAGGKPHDSWRWTADMRATVTRPFFALAAGLMLGREGAPRGEADLIRGLVENSLATGKERSAVTSSDIRSVLEGLAVALTRTGGDGLSFADLQIARSSRLVADSPEGALLFALPIFQHWFAAQAILNGRVPAVEVVADAASFNRWRWAAAVAALSAPTPESVDDLLSTWVAGNPGAAAWVINEAFGGHRNWRTADGEDLDVATSGGRLLRALRTWADAIGPLAEGVLPSPLVRGPVGLGVTVTGHRIEVAFSTSRPAADYVTEVPSGVHPLVPVSTPGWLPWISGGAPEGNAWPWAMVRNRIADATLKKLSNDPFLGTPEGIWVHERRFDLARRLLRRGSLFHGDLPTEDVKQRAVEAFTTVGCDREAALSFSGAATFSGAELEDLVSWIETTAPAQLVSHLPDKDVEHPTSGWVWGVYSPQRLMEFEVEVYGRACEAFDEALTHSFVRLGWSMPSAGLAPFGVVLQARFDVGARLGDIPALTAMRVPMAMMQQMVPDGAEATWAASGRAVITEMSREEAENGWERHSATLETIRTWLAEQNREPLGALGWVSTGADDMSNVRPASSLAAGWLYDDLKSLGLGAGTVPQLR